MWPYRDSVECCFQNMNGSEMQWNKRNGFSKTSPAVTSEMGLWRGQARPGRGELMKSLVPLFLMICNCWSVLVCEHHGFFQQITAFQRPSINMADNIFMRVCWKWQENCFLLMKLNDNVNKYPNFMHLKDFCLWLWKSSNNPLIIYLSDNSKQ